MTGNPVKPKRTGKPSPPPFDLISLNLKDVAGIEQQAEAKRLRIEGRKTATAATNAEAEAAAEADREMLCRYW